VPRLYGRIERYLGFAPRGMTAQDVPGAARSYAH
jgi:hypothetical protein